MTKTEITTLFVQKWSEEGMLPKSVFSFCKTAGISEEVFYSVFPSLQAVEKTFWQEWMEEIISAVTESEAWASFGSKERYLSFLFGVTAASFKYRSLLLDRMLDVSPLSNPLFLEGLRERFLLFAEELISYGQETKEIAPRGKLIKLYSPLLYLHFRFVLLYLLKDESDQYQKTDAFIEKTVTFAFDLFRSQAPESALDLVKFLLSSSSSSSCSLFKKE